MDPKQKLEEAIEWTKQAGTWLNKNQPSFAKFTDPIMMRASANLGYLTSVHEFVEATQAPLVIQTALYSAAGVGMAKWNEIVVAEINRALNEYNSRQPSGNEFGWAKSLLLAGTASLAISTAAGSSDSQGTPFSSEQRVEYVNQDLVQEPVNETSHLEIILEPEHNGDSFFDDQEQMLDYDLIEDNFLSLREESPIQKFDIENVETLRSELEATYERVSLLEKELHPKAQKHYENFSGKDHHRIVRKIERTEENGDLLRAAAEKYEVPYTAMFALTIKESDGKERAKSCAGARGLMQIMPRTGKYIAEIMGDEFVELTGRSTFRTSDLYEPEINIEMGAFYLRFIHDRYGERILKRRGQGNNDYKEWDEEDLWDFTMACYNRGPSGMTRNMINAGADTYWDLEKGQTTDEVLRYVSKIRAIEKVYVEYLQEKAGISNEVARLVH
jgi:soluble lytic murein transglycosylase